MRFEASQQMRMGQHMKLAPRMIQSMEILQLSALALEERVEQELESNIALEMDEPQGDAKELAEQRREDRRNDTEGERELVANSDDGAASDFERLNSMEQDYSEAFDNEYTEFRPPRTSGSGSSRDGGDGTAKMEAMANTAARGESLEEQLRHQWALAEVDEETRVAGRHLINYIDDDGYIRTEMDAIADQAPQGVSLDALELTLLELQEWLEPTGIGARNLQECLLLQLDQLDEVDPATDRSIERKLVEEYLPDIELNRLPKISQKSGLTLDQIKHGLDSMRALDPRPGRSLIPDSPSVVIPDAIIEYDDASGQYVAQLCDGRAPRLRISPQYATMAKDRSVEKDTRKFVDENVRNARWLISAIDQRNNTILRVIRAVVAHQTEFFDLGPQSLKPLPMTQVADQLGIHVATVSRAVSGKWIQTPRGILPLRKFFSAGTATDDGDDMSWDAVRETLREIIDGEDKSAPLGDDKLASELRKRGITIARRTVAKYRDQLSIPPARMRKEY
ncbi:MAG: RNA polymerase sigma-54 factor [Planctomycetes bacterium]|nr:RNA polymerase sigma-54 factor [Planctomycetota bacterium]NOG55291.1 RNA polymerase factor sigma-54 [Planctomycetota bacterium]